MGFGHDGSTMKRGTPGPPLVSGTAAGKVDVICALAGAPVHKATAAPIEDAMRTRMGGQNG
jgi:hypothetical protein